MRLRRKHYRVLINLLMERTHKIGAEIGVFQGVFASKLLLELPGIERYYCIDPWELYDDHIKTLRPNSSGRAFKRFKRAVRPWEDKVVVIKRMSQDALIEVPDCSLDWVFIDANHSYEYAKSDIIGWSKKVKTGGIVSGHDFYDKNKNARRGVPFGVEKAVIELVENFTVDAEANVWYSIKE